MAIITLRRAPLRPGFTLHLKKNTYTFSFVSAFRQTSSPWWFFTNQNWGTIICLGPLRLDVMYPMYKPRKKR